jgi:hypothetical protein
MINRGTNKNIKICYIMNLRRLLNTELGKILISIMLGIGLATLFTKVCKDKNCIHFKGPILKEIDGKIYKHNNKCYKYEMQSSKCDSLKKVIDVSAPEEKTETKLF